MQMSISFTLRPLYFHLSSGMELPLYHAKYCLSVCHKEVKQLHFLDTTRCTLAEYRSSIWQAALLWLFDYLNIEDGASMSIRNVVELSTTPRYILEDRTVHSHYRYHTSGTGLLPKRKTAVRARGGRTWHGAEENCVTRDCLPVTVKMSRCLTSRGAGAPRVQISVTQVSNAWRKQFAPNLLCRCKCISHATVGGDWSGS
jgi:hypothetical protein